VRVTLRGLIPCGLLAFGVVACSKDTPAPPVVTPGPSPSPTVTGVERLGWNQTAADGVQLATFHYAIYVDGARAELMGASCQPSASPASAAFDCLAPLPAMSAGIHTLELATFIVDPSLLESARSAPLMVNKTSAAATARLGPAATWSSGMTVNTSDGQRLRIDRIADGLSNPTDIAFAPDGRVFVAEEPGLVRVLMPDGQLVAVPALSLSRGTRLLALTIDPRFTQTRFVYAIYAAPSRTGPPGFTLARFREASNAMVDGITLLGDIPASATSPAASLRGGADGKLFAAFDDGDDPRRAGDLASPSGKILRLNPDGTTPADQAGLTPVYASDLRSPRGFDWPPASTVLWLADRVSGTSARLSAIDSTAGTEKRGATLATYALPSGTVPSSVAFYRGALMPAFQNNVLVASDEGRHLLRVRLDSAEPTRVTGTERLLQDAIGGVRVVAVSPGGVIYLATADAIATLTPATRAIPLGPAP
jgi:glucose/arabinose dehydrogenase